jgi:NTP pyrophosphatase (non-canonical NTP hydrolase)
MSLDEMQAKQKAWSQKNFGDRQTDAPLLGMIEELGELCEAVRLKAETDHSQALIVEAMVHLARLAHIELKRKQGIRKASTSYDRQCDAIDQLNRVLDEYYTLAGYPPNNPLRVEPELFEASEARTQDAIGDVVIYAMDFCGQRGWSLQGTVETVLTEVLKRDWRKAPSTGVAS